MSVWDRKYVEKWANALQVEAQPFNELNVNLKVTEYYSYTSHSLTLCNDDVYKLNC